MAVIRQRYFCHEKVMAVYQTSIGRPGEPHSRFQTMAVSRFQTMAVMPGEGHGCFLDIYRFGQEKLMTVIRQRQLCQEKAMVVMPGEGLGCLSDIYRLGQENFMAVIRQGQFCQEKVMAVYNTSVGLVRRNS